MTGKEIILWGAVVVIAWAFIITVFIKNRKK